MTLNRQNKTTFNDSWKRWIKLNVSNGQDKNGIFKILLDEGYTFSAIEAEMGFTPTVPLNQLVNPLKANANRPYQQSTVTYGEPIHLSSIYMPNGEVYLNNNFNAYSLKHFLTPDECIATKNVLLSNIDTRTLNCNLSHIKSTLINALESRICQLIGIHVDHSEALIGSIFKPYSINSPIDRYFNNIETKPVDLAHGYLVTIYLNEIAAHDTSSFVQTTRRPTPATGLLIIWKLSPNNDSVNMFNSYHQAAIQQGHNTIIAKWFHTKKGSNSTAPIYTKEANEFIPSYTRIGFVKQTIPADLFTKIQAFYQQNQLAIQHEVQDGRFIINQADKSQTASSMLELPTQLRQEIHDCMKPMLENWCGQVLVPTYVYGIRIYHRNAVLKPHRDRLETHIISVIINVDQAVDEDWPLVIQDNDYRTHHISLKPGEMIFYESARLSHGRPKPLNGDLFANIFCHFTPESYTPRKLTADA